VETSAYEAMQALHGHHWWWNGMAWMYRNALDTFLPKTKAGRKLIDVGCGYGSNFPVLNPLGDVVGVDLSLEVLRAIKERPCLGLVQARADALPFKSGSFDVVALLAVIEHADQDESVLVEAHRIARHGALQLLSTSAFMLLWSQHDVANGHRRRYRLEQMRQLETAAHWQIKLISYVNAFIFPLSVGVRLFQRVLNRWQNPAYNMGPDLRIFDILLRLECWLVLRLNWRLPWGVNLIVVASRDD
jgi:SAM-dependent methyltransferase